MGRWTPSSAPWMRQSGPCSAGTPSWPGPRSPPPPQPRPGRSGPDRPRPLHEHHRGFAGGVSLRAEQAARRRRARGARVTSPAAPTYRIAVIPGDGIGPEVIAAGRRVLDAVGERFGFAVEWLEIVVGGRAIDTYGGPIRDEDLAICAGADAVFLGAIGGPKWDDPNAAVRPEQALFPR